MGAMKNAKAEAKARKYQRKFVNGYGTADWATADANLLRSAVETVARMGGALRLGYTRDGGAYSIGIYGDGDPFTEYVRPSEDLDRFLKELVDTYS